MEVVLETLLNPVMSDVQRRLRELRGLPGRVQEAVWTRSGAIVVEWKAPVPARVRALGARPGGAEVRVVARRYSSREMQGAIRRTIGFLDAHDIRWSILNGCSSGRGIELAVPSDPEALPVTRAELEDAAGMRVLVERGTAIAV